MQYRLCWSRIFIKKDFEIKYYLLFCKRGRDDIVKLNFNFWECGINDKFFIKENFEIRKDSILNKDDFVYVVLG